jgi:uncharacterized protein (TIGR03067 family)
MYGESLQGCWSFQAVEVDGVAVREAHYRDATLEFDGPRFVSRLPDGRFEGDVSIDVSRSPATIDLWFTTGMHRGLRALGIFEFQGASLRLCVGMPGSPRPDDFATSPGSGRALELLQRLVAAG